MSHAQLTDLVATDSQSQVEPPKYPGGHDLEWIIPVPQSWYSLTGKEAP